MPAPIEIPDDGLISVKIGDVTKEFDAYATYHEVMGIGEKFAEKSLNDWQVAIMDYLKAKGFPPCSLRVANHFWREVQSAVDAMGKADAGETTPVSPAGTEPTSSDSPAA